MSYGVEPSFGDAVAKLLYQEAVALGRVVTVISMATVGQTRLFVFGIDDDPTVFSFLKRAFEDLGERAFTDFVALVDMRGIPDPPVDPVSHYLLPDLPEKMDAKIAEIDCQVRASRPYVGIFCSAGWHRSWTAGFLYLVERGGFSTAEALRAMALMRPHAFYYDKLNRHHMWVGHKGTQKVPREAPRSGGLPLPTFATPTKNRLVMDPLIKESGEWNEKVKSAGYTSETEFTWETFINVRIHPKRPLTHSLYAEVLPPSFFS